MSKNDFNISDTAINAFGIRNSGVLLISLLLICVLILVLLHTRLPAPEVVAYRAGYTLADGDGHSLRFTQDTATNRAGMSMSGNELPIVSNPVGNYERLGELNQEYADRSQAEYLEENNVQTSSRSGYKPYRRNGMELIKALHGENIQWA